jgi:hypothetical protein
MAWEQTLLFFAEGLQRILPLCSLRFLLFISGLDIL